MIEPFTRIIFTKTIISPACGDHPELIHAEKGELGVIGAGISPEGKWAKTNRQNIWFGVYDDEIEEVGPE